MSLQVLDKFINERYTEHFDAMNDAAQRMEQGNAPEQERLACSQAKRDAVSCEMQVVPPEESELFYSIVTL